MEQKFGDKLSKLDLTDDEIKRLSECMKDDKFVELLRDYALEISDPENKKKYEEEIAVLEMERGNDVKFIHPCPGHVLKTSKDGEQKCFINICSSPKVGKPVSKATVKGSSRGMQWSIPHTLSQPREDTDKAGGKCVVYDVVFNPDTYHMSEGNTRFRKMIHDMALDAVERLFQVTLDKVNVKKPKMKFKGHPQASIVRMPREDTRELDTKNEQDSNDPLRFPYPPMPNFQTQNAKAASKASTEVKSTRKINKVKSNEKVTDNSNPESVEASDFVEPKYTLTHRGYFDMKEYHSMPEQNVVSTRPKELLLNIELPMLQAASALHLEIFEDCVAMECAKPVKYKLDLKLPFPVDDSKGHARFDKSKRRLSITLEVLPPILPAISALKSTLEDICGSCSYGETEYSSGKQMEEVALTVEDPSENNFQPSDHPSGLVYGRSRCRHQNHGSLWGRDYTGCSDDSHSPGYLYNLSSLLVEKLAEQSSGKARNNPLQKTRPQIFYHQDDMFVTVIINVPFIDREQLWYVLSPQTLQFSAISAERCVVTTIHQIFIMCTKGEEIDPRRSRVDVSDDNAVFLLRKHQTSQHEWQAFQAGFDSKNLKTLSFGTEKNVNDLISSVKKEAQKSVSRRFECEDVSDLDNSELLALKLLPKEIVDEFRLSDDSEGENDAGAGELPSMAKALNAMIIKQEEREKEPGLAHCIDHKKILMGALDAEHPITMEPETDEDDDSATYETAESLSGDEDEHGENVGEITRGNDMTGNEVESETILQEFASAEKSNGQQYENDGKLSETNGQKDFGNVTSDSDKKLLEIADEALVLHEYEKNGGKTTKIVTNHKTKSVITLGNDMLFEIDSD